MKKKYFISGVLLFILMLAAVSCNKTGDNKSDVTPANSLDRKPMLENYANNYIITAYAKMSDQLSDLQTAVKAFVDSPDDKHLDAAKKALHESYLQWQRTELYEFGPAEDVSLRTFMNTYPVTVIKVNSYINSGSYDLDDKGNKDAQGFPALDYLLNGLNVNMYTTDGQAAARKRYLGDVVTKMTALLATVRDNWDGYKNSFINNTGTDASSSLSQLANGYIHYYEAYLRGGKIGIPVGAITGSPLPDNTESLYAPAYAKEYLATALQAMQNVYAAKTTNGECLKSYLATIGTKDDHGKLIADLIDEEMEQAITGVKKLDGTLYDNINNNRQAVLAIFDEVQDVVPLLKVDMVSALGISITYTDNDGD